MVRPSTTSGLQPERRLLTVGPASGVEETSGDDGGTDSVLTVVGWPLTAKKMLLDAVSW